MESTGTTTLNQQEHSTTSEPNDQIFAGKQLRCLNQVFLSTGGYGTVYRGFWNNKEVAVRGIKTTDCLDTWKNVVDKNLNWKLNNENVLKIIGVEDNEVDQSRYFALELYAATLEQFCTGEYTGPMPSEAQVLNQIARGVNYLHKNRLAHGNLNPQTILISQSQPVQIKVSEFGLCKYYEKDKRESLFDPYIRYGLKILYWFFTGDLVERANSHQSEQLTYAPIIQLSHPKYWMRAKYESLPVDQDGHRSIPRATVIGDVFATGCLFFYYLKRGLHPFGDSKSIVDNISKKISVNLKELNLDHIANDGIKNLIGDPPTDGTNYLITFATQMKDILPLTIDEKAELGRGGFGNNVFAGTFEGKKVAVKRISVADTEPDAIKREVEYQNRLNHKNVLKLLHVDEEKDPRFKYLVLELCAGTLTNYCETKYDGPELPRDAIVLFQIALGLAYIHSSNLVHRDVKPDNILISITSPVQIKLSDLGFCKTVSLQGDFSQSRLGGTLNWMAPELLEIISDQDNIPDVLSRGTIESDTFAAGCAFFYFLTRGSHPFGNRTQVPANICRNNPVLLNEIKLPKEHFGHALVGGMIKKLDERTKLKEVIQLLLPYHLADGRFKKVTRTFLNTTSAECECSRFHPIYPVLACRLSDGQVILFESTSRLVPFSNWRENKKIFTQGVIGVKELEWNVNGTRLAAGFLDGTVIAWSYPSGHVLFQMNKHSYPVGLIVWNPFRQDVLATREGSWKNLLICNTQQENGDAEKAYPLLTIECDVDIKSVAWISENQIALGLGNGWIEICQFDDIVGETTAAIIIERFKHGEGWITDLQWNETTGYLAAGSLYSWIKIWSLDSDQPVYSLEVDSSCFCLAWRRKGKTWSSDGGIEAARKLKENLEIVCGLYDGSIVIWNPLEEDEAKRKRILPQKHSNNWVQTLSFSPDGRFLASADYNKEIIIWSTKTWQSVYTEKEVGVTLSWLSTDPFSVPVYKLAVSSRTKLVGGVRVLELSAPE